MGDLKRGSLPIKMALVKGLNKGLSFSIETE